MVWVRALVARMVHSGRSDGALWSLGWCTLVARMVAYFRRVLGPERCFF